MRDLRIAWGMIPPTGHSWVRIAGGRGLRLHLTDGLDQGTSLQHALCGVTTDVIAEYASGLLCPKCAKAAGIHNTAEDLEMDEDKVYG